MLTFDASEPTLSLSRLSRARLTACLASAALSSDDLRRARPQAPSAHAPRPTIAALRSMSCSRMSPRLRAPVHAGTGTVERTPTNGLRSHQDRFSERKEQAHPPMKAREAPSLYEKKA